MTYTIQNIAINLRKDKISILEITQLMLKNIKANDLNAFISVFEQESIQKAKELDTQLKKLSQDEKEQLPLLYGIPLAIKDLFCTIDGKTTAGSAMLRNYESPIESTVTSKLKQLNSIFIGKTNLDEFAMGSSNETSYFKYVKNPIDPTRTPGGSSGGSAAAIGANQAIAALGTDTGGSVRLPASYTGSVAMRPTYGSCSRYGIAAFASSLDQPGPMTKNIKDNAILLNAIYGKDPNDSRSIHNPNKPCFLQATENNIKDYTIGVPYHLMKNLPTDTQKAWEEVIKILISHGAKIKEVKIPMIEYGISMYYILASAEASTNLAQYDGVRYGYRSTESNNIQKLYNNTRCQGFGEEVKRRILLGTFVLSASAKKSYYSKARHMREIMTNMAKEIFKECNAICMPTSVGVAPHSFKNQNDPVQEYLNDIFTVFSALTGTPALSTPMGFCKKTKLPLGIQICADQFNEHYIYAIAQKIENAQVWKGQNYMINSPSPTEYNKLFKEY